MTFVTYQVNAIALGSFEPMEVLPYNQANISIMRPELLSAFQEAESEVRINRVGDVQLKTTKQTGYLPNFFCVYSSSNTKANVLSFSNIEDLYEVRIRHRRVLRCGVSTGQRHSLP
jgi:hypothetical protein